MFTDLVGSTALGEQRDPETVRRVMDRYFQTARAKIEYHGGVVEKFIGDAVMGVFGVPLVHEDDALRAARAALQIGDEITKLNVELEVTFGVQLEIRTGICTGDVIAQEGVQGERIVTGDAVNVAARLEQAAEPGTIFLSEVTRRLLGDAVQAEPTPPLDLKGKSEPLQAWRLLGVAADAGSMRRRPDSPLVGRETELDILRRAFDQSRRARLPQLVTILGEPGVGKTRLAQEAVARVASEATVLRGRVQAYGERKELQPIVEILEGLGRDEIRRQLADVPGGEHAALTLTRLMSRDVIAPDVEQIPAATRLLLESIGRNRPLVLVIDDVHWAEGLLLDVIEHLALRARETALTLVCLARMDLLDSAPDLPHLSPGSRCITLEPLGRDESELVIAGLLGGVPADHALVAHLAETCQGNPLFLEQFVGSLIDDGSLCRRGDAWVPTCDLTDLPTPPSIAALLEARLEQLPASERGVLEGAAVEGVRFHEEFLRELTPRSARPALDGSLHKLLRRGLILSDEPLFPGHDALRFAHVLVQEAAYARVPKEQRARYHERFADWLMSMRPPPDLDIEGVVGWHLERAFQFWRELGLRDEHVHELGVRAGDALEAAAHREADRGAYGGASDLFLRASRLPTRTEIARAHRLLDAAINARQVPGEIDGGFSRILDLLDQVDRTVDETGDRSLAVRARAQRVEVTGTIAEHRLPYDRATEAEWLGRALGDPALEARARDEARWSLWLLRLDDGDVTSMYALAEEMLADAETKASVRRRRGALLAWLTTVWVGQLDVARDLRRVETFIDAWRPDLVASERLAATEALLLALAGRHDEARVAHARQRACAREAQRQNISPAGLAGGQDPQLEAELAASRGDLEEEARNWRAVVQRTEQIHAGAYASSYRLLLARALLRRGRPEDMQEAERAIETASRQHLPGDMQNEAMLPECRSLLAYRRGDLETAARHGRTAVAVADTTGWLWAQGSARVALALALAASGLFDEAEEVERAAVARYELSGSRALADWASSFLSRASGGGDRGGSGVT